MKFNFLKNVFRKKYKDDKEFANNEKSSSVVEADINIENNDNFIKIEIKNDCTLEQYSAKIDSLLQANFSNLDKSKIDIIDKFPIRMLISNGIKTINSQTIYLICNNNIQYTISMNTNNIYLSERERENKEIKESTIAICFINGEYHITKYIHDINRSTKSVKTYNPSNSSNQYFYMSLEQATIVVETMFEHLEQIEGIKNILNLDNIHSYLKVTELAEAHRSEGDIKIDNENNNKSQQR